MSQAATVEGPHWVRIAEAFATRHLVPAAADLDLTDRLPVALRRGLAESGLMGLTIPVAYGGSAADARTMARVLEILSTASAAVATVLSVHLLVAAGPIIDHGTEAQKQALLPRLASGEWLGAFALSEPGVGSDAAHLATRYSRDGDGFRLRGNKMFTTSAESAEVIVLFATRDPDLGSAGISAFALTKGTPGLSVGQRLDKLGIRGSETVELVLEDAKVAGDGMLGAEGDGFHIAMEALAQGRIGIAACALGVARAAFESMRDSARADPADWKRTSVAQAFTEVEAAAALVRHAAELRDAGAPSVEAASAAKLFASQVAVRTAYAGVDVAGPKGVQRGALPERLLRDARVFPIVEGTTEIQQMILGRSLLGRS